jgi:hypothetical protein
LIGADETSFSPNNPAQRKADIGEARRLALSFAAPEAAAAELDFAIDLPLQWVE